MAKLSQILCANMPYFRRPSHIYSTYLAIDYSSDAPVHVTQDKLM